MMQKEIDNRKTALAIILSVLVVMIYMEMVMKPQRPLPQVASQNASRTSPSQPLSQPSALSQAGDPEVLLPTPNIIGNTQTSSSLPLPSLNELKEQGTFTIETPGYRSQISLLGGRVLSFILNNHKSTVGKNTPLELINASPGGAFPLGVEFASGLTDARLLYNVTNITGLQKLSAERLAPQSANGVGSIELTASLPQGGSVVKLLTISGDSYAVTVDVSVTGAEKTGKPLWLEWTQFAPKDVAESRLDPKNFAWLTESKSLDSETAATFTNGKVDTIGASQWVVFSGKYFMEGLIAPSEPQQFRIGSLGRTFFIKVAGSEDKVSGVVYAGPKDSSELARVGYSLQRAIDLGFFSFLAAPLLSLLRFFYSLLGNYGLAIILLTLTLKLLFLPLTGASYKSMAAMQEIQPEVQALREKHTDATRLNQEMMALYKRKGVNPLGGCLPILIQIPVFFGLYSALLQSIELRHASFALWIDDLSSPERLMLWGIPVPLMIILMGISMITQQWTQPSSVDPAQKRIMMLMPVVFTGMFIIFPMPAGLVLYWLVNNVISIIQQMYLKGHRKANPFVATVVASVGIFSLGFILTLI
jgi:YidC/Oxa1 family membrane protein insertase